MSNVQVSLDAAAADRKARLAKLASLKRKRSNVDGEAHAGQNADLAAVTDKYLSGRNYDVLNKGPKLGFEQLPTANESTVEQEAAHIALLAKEQTAKDEAENDQAIDLFKLQPKKPNWDLKRDLAERMKIVEARTQAAIARLVRERIENAKKDAQGKGKNVDEGEELGVEGSTLVEAVHQREQEEQDEERRDRELEEEDNIS